MSKELDVAIKAAKVAGKTILKYYGNHGGKKTMKSEHDFSTEADDAAEKVIIATIKKAFPNHSILAEESGETDNNSEYKWIIDPLDGTINFAWGLPLWQTSIALEKSGEVIVSATLVPLLEELFTAEKDKGAFLNGKRIHVSERTFPHCMIGFGGVWRLDKDPIVKKTLRHALEKFSHHFRVLGSAVYPEACVAAGRLDAFPCFAEKPWDVAAGILLVKEAGGIVTDTNGNPASPYSENFIFSNKTLYNEIMKVISA